MNNEIKEILDYLKDNDNYIEDIGGEHKRIGLYETKILLNYITNLQEYNQIYNIDNKEAEEIINKNDILKKYFINLKHEIIDVNKYRNEIEILRKENFKLQEENDRLKQDNADLEETRILQKQEIEMLKEEIERLNNIINELEKYICQEWYCFDNESVEHEIAKSVVDKIKELKEKSDLT